MNSSLGKLLCLYRVVRSDMFYFVCAHLTEESWIAFIAFRSINFEGLRLTAGRRPRKDVGSSGEEHDCGARSNPSLGYVGRSWGRYCAHFRFTLAPLGSILRLFWTYLY